MIFKTSHFTQHYYFSILLFRDITILRHRVSNLYRFGEHEVRVGKAWKTEMNKYSESVINNFANKTNVNNVFNDLCRKYIANYGPNGDIESMMRQENIRANLINSYLHRQKDDLMYIGVTNDRVQDQVNYLNAQFIMEHLPLFYELSKRASNGWGGIEPLPSQKLNDQYSVSGRSIVSDARREVVSDTNTHESKYVDGQTNNAPWKSPEQLVRESANKTLESWRYNTRPRIYEMTAWEQSI